MGRGKLPHSFLSYSPKVLRQALLSLPHAWSLPDNAGSKAMPLLLSRQTIRKLGRKSEGLCARRTCHGLEEDRIYIYIYI